MLTSRECRKKDFENNFWAYVKFNCLGKLDLSLMGGCFAHLVVSSPAYGLGCVEGMNASRTFVSNCELHLHGFCSNVQ